MEEKEIIASGLLKYNDDIKFNCSARITWKLSSTKRQTDITITTEITESTSTWNLLRGAFYPWEFKGITDTGKELLASRLALISTSSTFSVVSNINLKLSAGELKIGNITKCSSFVFFIPNFIIGFNSWVNEEKHNYLNKTYYRLEVNDELYLATFEGIDYLYKRAKKLAREKTSSFTVKVTICKKKQTNKL